MSLDDCRSDDETSDDTDRLGHGVREADGRFPKELKGELHDGGFNERREREIFQGIFDRKDDVHRDDLVVIGNDSNIASRQAQSRKVAHQPDHSKEGACGRPRIIVFRRLKETEERDRKHKGSRTSLHEQQDSSLHQVRYRTVRPFSVQELRKWGKRAVFQELFEMAG